MPCASVEMLVKSLVVVLASSALGCFEYECNSEHEDCEGDQLPVLSHGTWEPVHKIPDPECHGQTSRCDGDTRVLCSITPGMAIDRYECSAWSAQGICVTDAEGTAFCAAAREPDLRCDPAVAW